ncbi:MAG: 23S rRNA (uracil(1939)-C(5))-methyltransferase RlmD, partial [candidate division WOR-3 bacterium]
SQFPVSTRVGFYRRRSHDVLEVAECLLHPVDFDRVRLAFSEALLKTGERGYDERHHTGNVRHLIIRRAEPDGKLLVTVVTRTPHLSPKIWEALAGIEGVSGVVQSINPVRTNRILGTRTRLLSGQEHLFQTVLDKRFRVSAHSFFQVNISQAEELCRKVLKFVNPEGSETVLDLYCGVGMLSLILAPFVKRVIGIDLDEVAIMDAQENRRQHGAENAQFLCRDVDSSWPELKPDVVILDPPRKGSSPETIKRIVELAPSRIVYVSCNPVTLGRDLGLLEQMNYTTREVEPVDMFPQTFHVETVALVMPVWA